MLPLSLSSKQKINNSFLKIFLNNEKIPFMQPPLLHENCLITDFKVNAELFNSFFSKQCFLINHSKISTIRSYFTDESISTISAKDIEKIIESLDLNKPCDHDNLRLVSFWLERSQIRSYL